MIDLSSLSQPSIIEEFDFDTIKSENISQLKELLPDYQLSESDTFMLLIEAFSYKELFLRKRVNNAIKATLLSTASGSDLDNVATFYAIERLKGAKPYASYEFSLSSILDKDITIPADVRLTNEDSSLESYLESDVIIKAGETKATGTLILDKEIPSSEQKTQILTTSLPFVFKIAALEEFANGASIENDDKFRSRILQSLSRFSTAGSAQSYKYHSFSSDTRIDDVAVLSDKEGIVEVYIHSSEYTVDEIMLKNVQEALEDEKVRPLTDKVEIYPAKIKNVSIIGTIELFDLTHQSIVDEKIRANLKKEFNIGDDLVLSDIIRSLHIDGVYKVELSSPSDTITTSSKEVVKLSLDLNYIEAVYE